MTLEEMVTSGVEEESVEESIIEECKRIDMFDYYKDCKIVIVPELFRNDSPAVVLVDNDVIENGWIGGDWWTLFSSTEAYRVAFREWADEEGLALSDIFDY